MNLLVPVDLAHPLDLLDLTASVARRLSADVHLFTAIHPGRGQNTFPQEGSDRPPPAGDSTGGLIRPGFERASAGPVAAPVETRDQAINRLRASATEQLRVAAEQLSDLNVTIDVAVQPHPADAIAEYAARNAVDLVLMRTHGRTGVRRA